jgi:hypothetical protein
VSAQTRPQRSKGGAGSPLAPDPQRAMRARVAPKKHLKQQKKAKVIKQETSCGLRTLFSNFIWQIILSLQFVEQNEMTMLRLYFSLLLLGFFSRLCSWPKPCSKSVLQAGYCLLAGPAPP